MLDQEKYQELAAGLLWRAKKTRAGFKYSEDKFARCAGIIGEEGQPSAVLPLFWENDQEKKEMFYALSLTAKQAGAKAVFLIMDSRWVESTSFTAHFKIPTVADLGIEKYQAKYMEVMKDYNYTIANLPRHLWTEAVCVILKGPGITPIMKLASYVEGPDDTVQYVEKQFFDGDEWKAIVNILPDWWTVQ